jgi:hypothetical protein
MATTRGIRPEPEHQAVLSNLYDLQARLRGDPASLVPPRSRARVAVPGRGAPPPDELVRAARARVIALRAKLDQLEAELQTIAGSLHARDRDA